MGPKDHWYRKPCKEAHIVSKKTDQNRGMRNAAIYYRVSTDRQDLDSQKNVVETWLQNLPDERKPLSVKTYEDEGISGKTLNRPEFQRLLNDARTGKIDTIICYRLDRFSRHATTAIRLLLDLDEAGVAFISVTQPVLNLGHENPFRRTMLAAFAEIAEIERETIVARVRAGLDAAKKRGVRLGAPQKTTDDIKKKAEELRGQGMSYKTIATRLELSVGTVHKLLTTPVASLDVVPE
jgi:DNA invertase Pin-like site-specific DNA recombinase